MTEHPNAALLREFYEAFARHDGETMAAAYQPDAAFSDPVFRGLDGAGAGAMWRMLTERGADLRIEFSAIEADDERGRAHWEAWYTFSQTGKPVHNVIEATFEFRDGKISRHTDSFDLYRWTRMALGPLGTALGWSSLLQNALRKSAMAQLAKYRQKRGL